MNPLYKTKTFWTAVAGLLGIAAGYFTGELGLKEAIESAFLALTAIFLRAGIQKSGLK